VNSVEQVDIQLLTKTSARHDTKHSI